MRAKKRVLLLNSTHGRYPLGSDPWVQSTLAALGALDPDYHELITSVGLANWELIAFAAGTRGFCQRLIIPGINNSAGRLYYERCLNDFDLDDQLTTPLFANQTDSKEFHTARDHLAFETAETIYPISVRPDGRLDTLLTEVIASGVEIDERFRVEYKSAGWLPQYQLDDIQDNPGLEQFSAGWLTHWTHSHPELWPGEKSADFYRDMLANPETFVRSAASTLARIASSGKLLGSSLNMSGGEMMISLTALSPSEAVNLMRWRSRWRRWSMEPYGVAFRREALVRLGARPVKYYDKLTSDISTAEKKFSQSRGEITDWSGQQEWRVSGDIDLGALDSSGITLLVYDNTWTAKYPDLASQYTTIPLCLSK